MEIGVRKERMRHYNSQKSILNSMTVEKLERMSMVNELALLF